MGLSWVVVGRSEQSQLFILCKSVPCAIVKIRTENYVDGSPSTVCNSKKLGKVKIFSCEEFVK